MPRSPSRFLYAHKIIFGIVLFFSTLFLLPFFIWFSASDRPLSVTVIDKTVSADYREHRSLFWLMRHWKITQPSSGLYYHEERDYYGFFPGDSSHSNPSQLTLKGTDLLYITDTYGIFDYPMSIRDYEEAISKRHVPATLLYGGLNDEELWQIERFDSSGGMIIAEFNTLQDPQIRNTGIYRRMERMFGVRNTGALGRYYDDLAESPKWMKEAYEEQQHAPWHFSGKGIVITLEQRMRYGKPGLIVLDGDDLDDSPIFLRTTGHWSVRDADQHVPYYYFFEIMEPDTSADVAAYFDLHCTESGKEKLAAESIPLSFPAVVVSGRGQRKFYFAGDFADNEVDMFLMRYWNVESVFRKLFSLYYITDQTRFFWQFYLPVMKTVFDRSMELKRIQTL